MKVLVVSDFHGRVEACKQAANRAKLEKADLIVACGDLTQFGNVNDGAKMLSLLTNTQAPVFFVPGNTDPPELVNLNVEDATCLHKSCETLGNWAFVGVGGSRFGHLHSFSAATEKEVLNTLNISFEHCRQPSKLVVVSHEPPSNTLLDRVWYGEHVGSKSLRRFVVEKKPRAVFCGHIHEAAGIDYISKTVVVNPGPALHGHYAIAILNDKIEVVLNRFK